MKTSKINSNNNIDSSVKTNNYTTTVEVHANSNNIDDITSMVRAPKQETIRNNSNNNEIITLWLL